MEVIEKAKAIILNDPMKWTVFWPTVKKKVFTTEMSNTETSHFMYGGRGSLFTFWLKDN